jgi:hypothetical protein
VDRGSNGSVETFEPFDTFEVANDGNEGGAKLVVGSGVQGGKGRPEGRTSTGIGAGNENAGGAGAGVGGLGGLSLDGGRQLSAAQPIISGGEGGDLHPKVSPEP